MGKHAKKQCKCPPKKKPIPEVKPPGNCKLIVDIIKSLGKEQDPADYQFKLPGSCKSNKPCSPSGRARSRSRSRSRPSPSGADGCVPMAPPMHTRLRLRGEHCRWDYDAKPNVPAKPARPKAKDLYKEKDKKTVRLNIKNAPCCPLEMPVPPTVVHHTQSDQSILRVESPTVSGEFVNVRPASPSPSEHRPPLVARRHIELRKPRSGLYINTTENFIPDMVNGTGPAPVRKKKRSKKCCGPRARKMKYKTQARKRKRRRDCVNKHIRYHKFQPPKVSDGKPRHDRSTQKPVLDQDMCGPDNIPTPIHVKMPNLKRGTLQTHSLTVLPCTKDKKPQLHFGILSSSYNMSDPKYGARSRGQQALTMSVMAYCLAFHYHPKLWNKALMDTLLDCGDRWCVQCLDKVHDHSMVQGICEVLPFGKKQVLILNSKKMQIILSEPDVVGYTMTKDPTVYNLCRGLKVFFKCSRAGVFLSRVLKVVIWRDSVCYYVFDPAGRDARAFANNKEGKAALMNVQDLEGVAEVLLARSVLEDQKYVLASLKVLRMADENSEEDFSDHEMTPAEKAMAEYRILSESCAIVNANLHLGDACFEDAKYRQALPIAVVALTYSKISPANTWNTKTLDKILRLGTKLYHDCSQPKVLIDLTIDNIPTEITIGPYLCEIIIYRERVKGQLFTIKECILNIKSGLDDFFQHEYNSAIIQFNNYTLGIWRQKEMFYIFDPYPCSPDGHKAVRGKACVLMNLNLTTVVEKFVKSWDYLPATSQFCIHAFKVLKLKKNEFKAKILCPSTEDITKDPFPMEDRRKARRKGSAALSRGDLPPEDRRASHMRTSVGRDGDGPPPTDAQLDEEHLNDITSLVDSILEDYVPQIPLRYKNAEADPMPSGIANLDSPTVSVTQMVPPLPAPRDKSGEPPEPDPDPEPDPPPPPPPIPEGGLGEAGEEEVEEEEEKEEKEKEAAPVVELPPPPPSPEPEPEEELAPMEMFEEEVQTLRENVRRKVLLTADARQRYKLRQLRRTVPPPLEENEPTLTQSEEMLQPSNYVDIPAAQILLGNTSINDENMSDILPFVSIMGIVASYKYKINTWSKGTLDFVLDTGRKLFENKEQRFQLSPVHVIPKIAIGSTEYEAVVEVYCDGATWQLEQSLTKYMQRYDRCVVTTANYSVAVFRKNNLFYMLDGTPNSPVGMTSCGNKGNAVVLRFRTLHAVVHRFLYNKVGNREHQQFILSRILVRRLGKPPREQLPYEEGTTAAPHKRARPEFVVEEPPPTILPEAKTHVGFQNVEGLSCIEGTTCLLSRIPMAGVKECHFICLIAMLMVAIHPLRLWDSFTVDAVLEKGIEIYEKACNLNLCERRIIKNITLEDKLINITIKKVLVINENQIKTLDQYLKAVLSRMRYVIIRYPECCLLIYQEGGNYYLFDPYPPPKKEDEDDAEQGTKRSEPVATWTKFSTLDGLQDRLEHAISCADVDEPIFYTYELTSVKKAPKRALLNYKLSPIFKPERNPNSPLKRRRRVRPVIDEKMTWVYIKKVPWTRGCPVNDMGFERNTSKTLWKDWDIEFPRDLYSLWGSLHPLCAQFNEANRGKQMFAIYTVAIVVTKFYKMSEWTGELLDSIVICGDKYHTRSIQTIKDENHEMAIEDLDPKFEIFPYSFTVKFDKVIFGTVYSIHRDHMNLSRAITYFFERNLFGILVCHNKNLGFGLADNAYFMYDCQSYGLPVFAPNQGASYVLRCESINRLIYCMTVTLGIKRHGMKFDLYCVEAGIVDMTVK